MIGSKVSQMILDNKQLNFYKYDSDVKELLNQVRDNINQVCMHSLLLACFGNQQELRGLLHADHTDLELLLTGGRRLDQGAERQVPG